jgi:alpha-beta hydrolase superfamily lysophospholipase
MSKERDAGAGEPFSGRPRPALRFVVWLGRKTIRWSLVLTLITVTILATLAVGKGLASLRLPDLKLWHRVQLTSEFSAGDPASTATLADYLKREDRLFKELDAKVTNRLPVEDRLAMNRFYSGSLVNPVRFDPARNWNRTCEWIPDEPVRGGVLLLHGLTDSPYTLRHLADIYRSRGFYVLALRLPGHGTIPAALLDVEWEDWRAAVKVGARAVREREGPALPFHIVGYSNGGALALQYALNVLEGSGDPAPDQLVLISPMIGVSAFARLAPVVGWMGRFQPFEKARWLDIMPEYMPFKYNSFPIRAGHESYRLTRAVQGQIARVQKAGLLRQLPPILSFVSVVDATVSTRAVADSLYARLPQGRGDELVAFDLNASAEMGPFIRASEHALLAELFGNAERSYGLCVVANARPDTREVVERSVSAGSTSISIRPLPLAWPRQVYSLSHLALPMAPDDPLYGLSGPVGGAAPHGEKGVLTVPMDQFMRLYANPFFPYLREKVEATLPKG